MLMMRSPDCDTLYIYRSTISVAYLEALDDPHKPLLDDLIITKTELYCPDRDTEWLQKTLKGLLEKIYFPCQGNGISTITNNDDKPRVEERSGEKSEEKHSNGKRTFDEAQEGSEENRIKDDDGNESAVSEKPEEKRRRL